MMCVLQRLDTDHRLTYGELSIRDMAYVTLEPSVAYRKGMHERIPAGCYVCAIRTAKDFLDEYYEAMFPGEHRGMIELLDVPEHSNVLLASGSSFKHTKQDILVGFSRAPDGMIRDSSEAYITIYKTLVKAMDDGDEVFIDVRSGREIG